MSMSNHHNNSPKDEPFPSCDESNPKIQSDADFWEDLLEYSNSTIRAQSKNPCDGLPSDDYSLKPNNSINLSSMALKNENLGGNTMISLSKAAFSPNVDGRFICGTEEQDPSKKHQNKLIFGHLVQCNGSFTTNFKKYENNKPSLCTYNISEHVRDLEWVNDEWVIFAVAQRVGLIKVGQDLIVADVVTFPDFHTDIVREISICHQNANMLISGGFDGNVFVTDIQKLVADIKRNEKKSENWLYPCKEVVGSVRWYPNSPFIGSCTTDTGLLHIFDLRVDHKRDSQVYDTLTNMLYTHAYKDENTVLLGFGNGTIQVYDLRKPKTTKINDIKDPGQMEIGDIRFDKNSEVFAVFGNPKFTLSKYSQNIHKLGDYSFLPDSNNKVEMYKTAGSFIQGTNNVVVTDSLGNLGLFTFPK